MTVRKLSDSDKSDILDLYRQAGETTSTLADRYGVSNSTISRLLKSTLPEDEYEVLIASKRAARSYSSEATQTLLFTEPEPEAIAVEPLTEIESSAPTPVVAETKLNSNDLDIALKAEINAQIEQPLDILLPVVQLTDVQVSPVTQILREDLIDESENLTSLEDDDDDLDDDDLEDDDDDDLEDDDDDDLQEMPVVRRRISSEMQVQVLPLSEANLPKICYLVIDRASELITRPLKDFGDLGQIPTQEIQQKTLPVFDNHRVARRFSTKRDRVIKIPDSRLLQKTCNQLQAKGITRLLVDGQVYSLSPIFP